MVSDLTGEREYGRRSAAEGELTQRFQAALVVVPCLPRWLVETAERREKRSSMCIDMIQGVSMALKRIARRKGEAVVKEKQSCLLLGRV